MNNVPIIGQQKHAFVLGGHVLVIPVDLAQLRTMHAQAMMDGANADITAMTAWCHAAAECAFAENERLKLAARVAALESEIEALRSHALGPRTQDRAPLTRHPGDPLYPERIPLPDGMTRPGGDSIEPWTVPGPEVKA